MGQKTAVRLGVWLPPRIARRINVTSKVQLDARFFDSGRILPPRSEVGTYVRFAFPGSLTGSARVTLNASTVIIQFQPLDNISRSKFLL